MKFSEALTEYLDLREEEIDSDEWMSIHRRGELRAARVERMDLLLTEMDRIVSESRLS